MKPEIRFSPYIDGGLSTAEPFTQPDPNDSRAESLVIPEPDKETHPKFRIWISQENAGLIEAHIQEYGALSRLDYQKSLEENTDRHGNIHRDNVVNKPMTLKEHRILYLAAAGLGNIEIAEKFDVSDQTVKNNINSILKKRPVGDRSGLILQGIQTGSIEPLLIDADINFSGYPELSHRERTVYELLIQGYINRDIGEKLHITEQTTKNHVTSILRIIGSKTRAQAQLYELKRQDEIVSRDIGSIDLSDGEERFLTSLCTDLSSSSQYLPQPLATEGKKRKVPSPYKKLGVSNLSECNAAALLYGFGSINTFASLPRLDATNSLTPEDAQFLLRVGSFNDDASLQLRADLMKIPYQQLKVRLAAISSDYRLPSFHQTVTILKYRQLVEQQSAFNVRQQLVEDLKSKRG